MSSTPITGVHNPYDRLRRRGAIPPPLRFPSPSERMSRMDYLILAAEQLESEPSEARSSDIDAVPMSLPSLSSASDSDTSPSVPIFRSQTSNPYPQELPSPSGSTISSDWSVHSPETGVSLNGSFSRRAVLSKARDVSIYSITHRWPINHYAEGSDSETTTTGDSSDESELGEDIYADDELASPSESAHSSEDIADDMTPEPEVASPQSSYSRQPHMRDVYPARARTLTDVSTTRKRRAAFLAAPARKKLRPTLPPPRLREVLKEHIRRVDLVGSIDNQCAIPTRLSSPQACSPTRDCAGLVMRKAPPTSKPTVVPTHDLKPIEGSNACPATGCPYVQVGGQRKDLRRHIATHLPNKSTCGGITLQQAAALGIREYNRETVFEWQGVTYVGGCRRTYSRHDALKRHLDQDDCWCVGDLLAPYQGQDYEGHRLRPYIQRIRVGGRLERKLISEWISDREVTSCGSVQRRDDPGSH